MKPFKMCCKGRGRGAALALALALTLTGCQPRQQPPESSAPVSSPSAAEPRLRPKLFSHTSSFRPEPLVWSVEPVLTADQLPENHGGLELPIHGATGYTSVELPLWDDLSTRETALEAVARWEQLQEEMAQAAAAAAEAGASAPPTATPAPSPSASLAGTSPGALVGVAPAAPVETIPTGTAPAVPTGTASVPPAETASATPTETAVVPPAETASAVPTETAAVPPAETVPAVPTETAAVPPAETASAVPTETLPAATPTPTPPSPTEGALAVLSPGTAFVVLRESGEFWQVECVWKGHQITGWLEHRYCMVNLPDVLPSMVYNATNTYDSQFRACGQSLEGITGQALYGAGKTYNPRLGEDEFLMPVLYSMAVRLCAAQRAALAEGNTLVLYEAYRPREAQQQVVRAMQRLLSQQPGLKEQILGKNWELSWFISTGISNHQKGYAVDVSLARISAAETRQTGGYRYLRVTEYQLYDMLTPIHELSCSAAIFTAPVNSYSATLWKSAEQTPAMAGSAPAQGLQGYCTGAGLTPLASEWWHFNDLNTYQRISDNQGTGGFTITQCLSRTP